MATSTAPTVAANCASAAGEATSNGFELKMAGCLVDPKTLAESEPRISTGDLSCTEAEWTYLAETFPQYRVLQTHEVPGDTVQSLGWANVDRDIFRHPSGGPRSELVHLAGLSEPEPTCWTVRTTFD